MRAIYDLTSSYLEPSTLDRLGHLHDPALYGPSGPSTAVEIDDDHRIVYNVYIYMKLSNWGRLSYMLSRVRQTPTK